MIKLLFEGIKKSIIKNKIVYKKYLALALLILVFLQVLSLLIYSVLFPTHKKIVEMPNGDRFEVVAKKCFLKCNITVYYYESDGFWSFLNRKKVLWTICDLNDYTKGGKKAFKLIEQKENKRIYEIFENVVVIED